MKAAVVHTAGAVPVYGDFAEPVASADDVLVRVSASALSHVTRSRAAGTHYTARGGLPFVAGIDGVGMREDGRRVYFLLPNAPGGALAQRCAVPAQRCIALPDALDDTTAAAIAIPGMSSWAAFVERARLRPGETVLINGATGASGRLAVQVARQLGAGKVIATGRNAEVLQTLRRLGADVTIALGDDAPAMQAAFAHEFAQRIDVVLDYLWGASAEQLLIAAAKAGPDGVPIRFVQIGAASGATLTLPSAVLRSSALELVGSGIGSVALPRLVDAIEGVLGAAVQRRFEVPIELRPLQDVEHAWSAPAASRIVFTV